MRRRSVRARGLSAWWSDQNGVVGIFMGKVPCRPAYAGPAEAMNSTTATYPVRPLPRMPEILNETASWRSQSRARRRLASATVNRSESIHSGEPWNHSVPATIECALTCPARVIGGTVRPDARARSRSIPCTANDAICPWCNMSASPRNKPTSFCHAATNGGSDYRRRTQREVWNGCGKCRE